VSDLLALWKFISAAGLPFAMFLVIIASQRGWFVWKRDVDLLRLENENLREAYKLLQEEKDEWKELALHGEATSAKAARVAKARTT